MSKPKPVNQIDIKTNKTIKVWNSASEAQKCGGYNYSRIVLVCQGKAYSSNGYKWAYADKNLNTQYTPKTKPQKKMVIYYDFATNKEQKFTTTKEAAAAFNTTANLVRVYANSTNQFLKGNRKLPKYLKTGTFFYFEETLSDTVSLLQKFNSLKFVCKKCHLRFSTPKALASHIQFTHNISSKEYTIKYLFNNVAPVCKKESCQKKTRYISFDFKKYCKKHSKEAMSAGGAMGGKAEAWNKGKTKFDDSRIMKQAIEMKGQKNHFWGKQHSEESIAKIAKQKKLSKNEILERLSNRKQDFIFPEFDYSLYHSRQHQKIKTICLKCNKTMKKTLQSLERGSLCKFCYPFTVSRGELELGDFISKHTNETIIRNDRNVIAPYELDVYIPSLKLAFEYHGLYWHMDKGQKGFDKNLHHSKYEKCKEKNITLVQIFSNQWLDKQNLVKSMILNKLKANSKKIGARNTICSEITHTGAKEFFEKNHIHGHVKASKYFCLRERITNNVVSVLSVRKAFHKKYKNSIEIARFANKQNTTVVGGFSKLLKRVKSWSNEQGYKSIITYADLMYGTGNVYEKAGFDYLGHTGINYWYTDGTSLINRFKVRATHDKTEKEVAKKMGVYKIYGCGNILFQLNLNGVG